MRTCPESVSAKATTRPARSTAFFPSLLNEATNPQAKNMGFFANPPGPRGDDYAALGGQGISLVSYRTGEHSRREVGHVNS